MTPRHRSLLFAPATRPDVLRKLPRSGPDAVVLDLEDSVPPGAKADARANVRTVGPELTSRADGPAVYVRVNPVGSEWFTPDVEEGLCRGLTGIVVPKTETADEVAHARDVLSRAGRPDLVIGAGIETAAGVLGAAGLLAADLGLAYFGAEDFIADMGGVRRVDNVEVLYARSRVALAARLAGVPVLDMVVTDIGDPDRFRREALEARAMGYAGKLCIHPSQVPLANEAFLPTAAEIDRARRVVAAYDRAQVDGHAAVAVDGQMIDEPLARRARAVLDTAEEG